MDDEDQLRRPPPLTPYVTVAAVLEVPASGLQGTVAILQRAGARESGLIWYGLRADDGGGQVKLVVAPRQQMSRGNYHIAAEDLAKVVRELPPDWKPLAQVHSHPAWHVEHSRYDDRMVMSRRALSLVFPFYGRYEPIAFPLGVGVHEHQEGYWHLLPVHLAARRVVVTSGDTQIIDLR